jgi:hypothetical protein
MAKKVTARKEAKFILNEIKNVEGAFDYFVPPVQRGGKIYNDEQKWSKRKSRVVNKIVKKKTKNYNISDSPQGVKYRS